MTTLTITEADLATLVEAGAAGDAAAWRSLVTRFEPRLRNVARAYRLAPTDVDDILQATWLCLFTHIGRIREPAAIGGWLATTVRRECLRLLQRPVRERLTADPERADAREQDGPETLLLVAERRAALSRALATLPERQRRLMALLASDSAVGYEHISRTLAMPTGSIGPTRARCLARLLGHPELQAIRHGAG
jgi:RNA polymerase sigma factor (sigma-70 family)